jgi:hypothetical protein
VNDENREPLVEDSIEFLIGSHLVKLPIDLDECRRPGIVEISAVDVFVLSTFEIRILRKRLVGPDFDVQIRERSGRRKESGRSCRRQRLVEDLSSNPSGASRRILHAVPS